MLKPFSEQIRSPVEMGPQTAFLGGKMGVQTLVIGVAAPKRQNRCARLGGSLSQEPPSQKKEKKVAESLCAKGRDAQNRNP